MPARLLVVALDGADGRLLDRATLDGTLPTLSALRSRGRAWRLSSAPADTDDSLWASFQYGVGTGEHGRYECYLDDDHGGRRNAPDEEIDRETFWDRLSSQGHHLAVLDIPIEAPDRKIATPGRARRFGESLPARSVPRGRA